MSYKTTLILLAILVVVGGGVYWQDIRPGPKKEAPKATQILSFDAKDINSLEVTYNNKTTELHKEGDSKWQLTKPENADADYWSVEGMISRLGNLSANRALTGTVGDLATYGLDHPIIEAKVGTTQGKQDTLTVGDKSPDGTAYYVKRNDSDTIFLVSTSLISDVQKLVTNPPKAIPTPTPAPATPAPSAATPAPPATTPTPGAATPTPTPGG